MLLLPLCVTLLCGVLAITCDRRYPLVAEVSAVCGVAGFIVSAWGMVSEALHLVAG